MRSFIALLGRFRRDERGAFMVIFGILAIAIIAAAGAVVDFTSIEQARTRASIALDSAALGLQPTIYNTPAPTEATLKTEALQVLNERLNDSTLDATVDKATFNTTDGTLHLEAEITVPTAFVQLVGIPSVKARVVSEATRKRLNIEVAMVLDNSLSMNSSSRMTNLKAAAKCAENILLNGDCNSTATTTSQPNIKIGVVPFTSFVNVGAANKTKFWIDQDGSGDIANDNFDGDDNDQTPYTGKVNRLSEFTKMTSVSWAGCVEARKYPYDTDDTTPDTNSPDTLFEPEFAPDEPGAADGSSSYDNDYLNDRPSACTNKDNGQWVQTVVKLNCKKDANGDTTTNHSDFDDTQCTGTGGGTGTTTYTQKDQNGSAVTPAATIKPESINGQPANCGAGYVYSRTATHGNGNNKTYDNKRVLTCNYTFSDRELQERLCKYTGKITTSNGASGPNQDCPTNALQPLTTTKSLVTAAINAMSPQGFTNIHQGAIWGFHMLSPTEPLTEAAAYDTATFKVMIIMTDGENTINGWNTSNMNGSSGYTAYGYPWNNPTSTTIDCSTTNSKKRIQSSTYPCPGGSNDTQYLSAQNNRFAQTCTNAKKVGITIYTIGLATSSTSDPAGNKTLLTNCASGSDHAYFPTQSSDLTSVFTDIAKQLSKLRLSL